MLLDLVTIDESVLLAISIRSLKIKAYSRQGKERNWKSKLGSMLQVQ